MYKSTQLNDWREQLSAWIDASSTLTTTMLECCKQTAFIQCEAIRTLVQESVTTAKNVCASSCPSEMLTQVRSFTTNSVESGITKSQELFSALKTSGESLSATANNTWQKAQQTLLQSVGQLSEIHPSLSKVATESLNTILTTSNQAADAAAKVATQVAEVASKNIDAATKATLSSVKKATSSN